jgi:hypothetical protein
MVRFERRRNACAHYRENTMKRLILTIPFVLAACNSSPVVKMTNASASEVAAKVKEAKLDTEFQKPGSWTITMTMAEMNIPGMPPAVAEQMKAGMGKAKTMTSCVKAKDPKEANPQDLITGIDKTCRYDSFSLGAGKIDAKMSCNDPMGTRTMSMVGTYGPDAMNIEIGSAGKPSATPTPGAPANPMASMSMKMKMDAKRVGECTGKEQS